MDHVTILMSMGIYEKLTAKLPSVTGKQKDSSATQDSTQFEPCTFPLFLATANHYLHVMYTYISPKNHI